MANYVCMYIDGSYKGTLGLWMHMTRDFYSKCNNEEEDEKTKLHLCRCVTVGNRMLECSEVIDITKCDLNSFPGFYKVIKMVGKLQ